MWLMVFDIDQHGSRQLDKDVYAENNEVVYGIYI